MKITINDVISWEPCYKYTPTRLAELFAGRESLGPSDIARLDIYMTDRLWTLRHFRTPIEHTVDDQLVEFVCICIERVITLLEEHEEHSPCVLRRAVDTTREYQRQEVAYKQLWHIWQESLIIRYHAVETYTWQQIRALQTLDYIEFLHSAYIDNVDVNPFLEVSRIEERIAEEYGVDDRPWQTEQLIKCMEAVCPP